MAIRYSGDVEVAMQWDGRGYKVLVRSVHGRRIQGHVTKAELGLTRKQGASTSSEMYDEVARQVLRLSEKKFGKLPLTRQGSTIEIRRTFQSPCPYRS